MKFFCGRLDHDTYIFVYRGLDFGIVTVRYTSFYHRIFKYNENICVPKFNILEKIILSFLFYLISRRFLRCVCVLKNPISVDIIVNNMWMGTTGFNNMRIHAGARITSLPGYECPFNSTRFTLRYGDIHYAIHIYSCT